MKNVIKSTTQTALLFVKEYLIPGSTVVDATCGNGHDTLALAEMGAGKIYGFDIQQEAIERTEELLRSRNIDMASVHLINDSHGNMSRYIKENIQVAVFNLGYLPSASKEVVTQTESTLAAVRESMELLNKDGLICISMYSGHAGGTEEKEALLDFASALDEKVWHAAYINMRNQRNNPPEILLITKKRGV